MSEVPSVNDLLSRALEVEADDLRTHRELLERVERRVGEVLETVSDLVERHERLAARVERIATRADDAATETVAQEVRRLSEGLDRVTGRLASVESRLDEGVNTLSSRVTAGLERVVDATSDVNARVDDAATALGARLSTLHDGIVAVDKQLAPLLSIPIRVGEIGDGVDRSLRSALERLDGAQRELVEQGQAMSDRMTRVATVGDDVSELADTVTTARDQLLTALERAHGEMVDAFRGARDELLDAVDSARGQLAEGLATAGAGTAERVDEATRAITTRVEQLTDDLDDHLGRRLVSLDAWGDALASAASADELAALARQLRADLDGLAREVGHLPGVLGDHRAAMTAELRALVIDLTHGPSATVAAREPTLGAD